MLMLPARSIMTFLNRATEKINTVSIFKFK